MAGYVGNASVFGMQQRESEYELPNFDPRDVVEDAPESLWDRVWDDPEDDGFDAYLEEANPFDGSRYEDPDWTGTIDMNDGWE
jgi:hypothetical protein